MVTSTLELETALGASSNWECNTFAELCRDDFNELVRVHNEENKVKPKEELDDRTDEDCDSCPLDFPLVIRAIPPL